MVVIHVHPSCLNLTCREDGRYLFAHICLISRRRLQKTQACFTPCSQLTLNIETRCLASLDAVANQLEENPLRRKAFIVFWWYNVVANHFYLDMMETVVKSFFNLGLME